ncbi:hypothetical protein [Bacteroides nordii]
MKYLLILFSIVAISCSREEITETNKQELKTDITPAVVDSTDNGLDSNPDIGDWKPGSHGEVDLEEKEE